MNDILQRLFYPKAVAIIGASNDPAKIGGRPIVQNRELGFSGRLYPVNPGAEAARRSGNDGHSPSKVHQTSLLVIEPFAPTAASKPTAM